MTTDDAMKEMRELRGMLVLEVRKFQMMQTTEERVLVMANAFGKVVASLRVESEIEWRVKLLNKTAEPEKRQRFNVMEGK